MEGAIKSQVEEKSDAVAVLESVAIAMVVIVVVADLDIFEDAECVVCEDGE
jgi:hypothetical protein